MTHPSDLDLRKENHDRRVHDVNRHGWWQTALRGASHQPSRGAAFIAAVRRALGGLTRSTLTPLPPSPRARGEGGMPRSLHRISGDLLLKAV
jgi:hypothetical protein